MKVAVPLAVQSPDAGGGFTFERDVAEALLRRAGDSPHEFTLLTRGGDLPSGDTDNVRVVRFGKQDTWRWKWRWWRGTLSKIASRSGRRRLRNAHRRRAWVEQYLLESGAEFVWNLAPGTPTFELPYLAMVWDLQHRLQPFFPEVSHESEWDRRERFFRDLLQRATYVVTGNDAGQREIEQFYQVPRERIRLFPHPTPRFALQASVADPGVLAKWNLQPGFLFYPAQFWPHKNHAGVLEAAKSLGERYGIRPQIVFVGSDKSNRRHIEQYAAELGLADQLQILGFVSREELVALYQQATALVYLTFFGPENLPPLEAMALGCPVVASRVSGSEEQLGSAALLVDPRRPDEAADAIASLYRDRPLRESLIARGRERAPRYTAEDFVRGVLELLDEFAAFRRCWGRKAG